MLAARSQISASTGKSPRPDSPAQMGEPRKELGRRGWTEIRKDVRLNADSLKVVNVVSEYRLAQTVGGGAVKPGSRC